MVTDVRAAMTAAMTAAMIGVAVTVPVPLRLRLAQGGPWRVRLPGRGMSEEWGRSARSQTRA